MLSFTPYAGPSKLVIAFDIGTTYSRVSYCVLERGQIPVVRSVTRFPAQTHSDPNVPSLLYYDKSGGVRAAGAEALTEGMIKHARTEGWTKAEWWKLHLRPKNYLRLDDDLPALPPGKSAVDVLTDFIRYLFHCSKAYILECHPGLAWSSMKHSIEYILAHPDGFGVQQDLYRRAVERAGLVPSTSEGRSHVHMVTEGEASLRFCVANLSDADTDDQTAPRGTVVINAGGGMINSSVFSTTFNPFSCEEIAPAECRLQGSVFVTRRAGVLLQRKLKGWEHSSAEDLARFMGQFDQTTKLVIESDQEPAYVRVGGLRANSPKHSISFGELKLSGEEATGLFSESIDAIIDVFERQRRTATMQITMAFLVGGFAKNGLLWSRVESYFKARNISIRRPDSHINEAVADGVVVSYVDAILHKDSELVRRDSSSASSEIKELRQHLGALSAELGLAREELKATALLMEEKDRSIASFTARVAQLQQPRLQVTAQLHQCEVLLTAGRVEDATELLLKILDILGKEMSEATTKWAVDLKKRCIERLQGLGDAAFRSGKPEEAIARYSVALSLGPPNPIDILVGRSKARISKGLWQDALADADEAIKLDASSHHGYEMKCMALCGAEKYAEADNTLLRMLSVIEKSPDEEIRRLGENYISPLNAVNTIDNAIQEIFRLCPLVLIDLKTGELWDANERARIFKSEPAFKKLVSDVAVMKLDYPHVRQAVAEYFKWAMFSHTWEGKEPTFQDVNLVNSVWNLEQSPLNEKLRQFCITSRDDGHRWAWSDTCCIDKTTSAILSQSLTSMYMWYEEAAETLVYLADILSSAGPGALMKSRWMFRAWTLQELLASKVVRFYTKDWKLYLNDKHANHKESPQIKQELAQALGVSPETITSFQPEDLRVREKLRLASTRNATVEEDIAYSLIGIFSSDITPRYGLGKTALGHLLENIVARTGDLTIIAWAGKSSAYNSALPDSLAVYSQVLHTPPPVDGDELEARVESQLETHVDALSFYYQVTRLPRATFSNRCLHLPCITFSVKRIGVQELDGSRGNLYRAMVSFLGKVEFRSADNMPLQTPRKLVFVHPWLHDLRDPHDEFWSDDEEEVEVVVGQDSEEAESNASSGGSDDDFDISSPDAPLLAEPSVQVDHYRQALRLVARLGRPFNALLLERQRNGQCKRVATEHEITLPGVPYQKNLRAIRARVLEIV